MKRNGVQIFKNGGLKMAGRTQIKGLVFLICTLLIFGGCAGNGKKAKEVAKTPTDKKREALLKKIDNKFEDPESHYELGQLYQADGMWSQAEYCYNTTLSFDPVHRDAQASLVKVLKDGGNAAKSEATADVFTNQVVSSAEGSLRLGLAFQKQGLDDYALRCYNQALQLAPDSARINRQIGYYYLSKGDKARAKEYLTRSFQLNSQQPDVAGELGKMGVAVRIPKKGQASPEKLDNIVEKSEKK